MLYTTWAYPNTVEVKNNNTHNKYLHIVSGNSKNLRICKNKQ